MCPVCPLFWTKLGFLAWIEIDFFFTLQRALINFYIQFQWKENCDKSRIISIYKQSSKDKNAAPTEAESNCFRMSFNMQLGKLLNNLCYAISMIFNMKIYFFQLYLFANRPLCAFFCVHFVNILCILTLSRQIYVFFTHMWNWHFYISC